MEISFLKHVEVVFINVTLVTCFLEACGGAFYICDVKDLFSSMWSVICIGNGTSII